jgi:hypothetical protein
VGSRPKRVLDAALAASTSTTDEEDEPEQVGQADPDEELPED